MPRKRNKKKFPRIAVADDTDEVVLEPLPSIPVPRERLASLGLDRSEPRFHAVHFGRNGTGIVYDGRTYRTVPAEDAVDVSAWVAEHGDWSVESGDWLVVNCECAVVHVLSPEVAKATVRMQWTLDQSVPLETLFDERESNK